ncbi:MAG TPA: transcription termination factor NusA [Candidatus Limnocylindrales bacterium]|nr:transcription termination factor NusA [Candidatus Limnocylindrales bacterium]
MSRDFVGALLQLNAEKQVPRELLIHAVEDGIQSAYRRVAGDEDIHVKIDEETGKIRVYRARYAVEEVEDPLVEFTLEEARAVKPDAQPGELVETEELKDDVFGRIGAQTAKQIVLQRIREVERDRVFDQFASREGEMITGTVNRVEPRAIILDVGNNVEAILATSEQSAAEHYRIGQNVKAFVLEVRRSTRGPQILVSRTHKGFLKRLFELEVPEIHSGTVEIRAIAREAGSRSKVAVSSRQEGLDPVGATVGQRGARVQAVVAELGGEKIDVIPWNDDPGVFVANALSPAQVISVDIDEEHRIANVTVPERMLSLAIGREGQNARLAARLTGWRIDIRSDVSVAEARAAAEAAKTQTEDVAAAPAATNGTETVDAEKGSAPRTRTTKAANVDTEEAAVAPGETNGTEAAPAAEKAPAKTTRTTKAAKAAAEAGAADAPAEEPEAVAAAPAKKTRTKKAAADEVATEDAS